MKYVLVLSGKGGVGKTLVAINVAYELSKSKNIALIDADLSNPNAAELLGIKDQIKITTTSFTPIMVNGIEFFSMATISGNKPVSMDASEYAEILRDVLKHTNWKSEIAIIDMPAGIHNEFLELISTFGENLMGSIIVLQPAHIESARKVLQLHKTEGIPVLGIIENMSRFDCECGKSYKIFGEVDLEAIAKEYGVTPFGSIPLSFDIRKGIQDGKPLLPDSLKEPITNASEMILATPVVGPSFAEKIKERLKGVARDIMVEVVAAVIEISNTEVPIKDIQVKEGYPGGRVIALYIMDESLREEKLRIFFRVENGVLKLVKNPKQVDDEIRVWERALIWVFLGRRPDTNTEWDLFQAWLQGHVLFHSTMAGTPRAVHFIKDVWVEVRNTKSFARLKPLLERVA